MFAALPAARLSAARDRYQGEDVLRLAEPGSVPWEVSFEKDRGGSRSVPRTKLARASEGPVTVHLAGDALATGISAVSGQWDLSRFEEIHLWVQADAPLRVQPFSQSSGWVFHDGGGDDVLVPGDGRVMRLNIRRESLADPSMVQTIGLQVRDGAPSGCSLRLLTVTAIPRRPTASPTTLKITGVNAPSSGSRYAVYTVDFSLSIEYDNPYDPDQVDVQAHFVSPSGATIAIPAYWHQDCQVVPGTATWEQYTLVGSPHWRIRYLPFEEGQHTFRITARDKDSNADEAGPLTFNVAASPAPGPVRRHPESPLLLRYSNGAPYIPLGHNLGFEDGNPNLNGTAYYRSLLPVFAASGENWTRFWMTDFARTTPEWSPGHFSGFYQGLGTYSQRAAYRVDQFLEIALASGIQVQLVTIDHGQVSTFANQRWNSDGVPSSGNTGNPYSSAYGGPVPQTNPEQFFSNTTARSYFRRRLRYVVARWAAYPNLLAWELFNEVQWAGSQDRNIGNDASTRAAIQDWHREMADYLKSQDPFRHLVTTSSEDYVGSPGFAAIWNLTSIDMVQSHHYGQPPSARDTKIRDYLAAQQTYVKPVIIGEMGVKADPVPECGFDPQQFLSNSSVPAVDRTPGNRDHMIAGTTLRNGIWSAALAQSGAMNWWWGCYMSDDQSKNRLPPYFPLHMRLLPPLFSYWGGEDPSAGALVNASLQPSSQVLAYGLQSPSSAFVWVRDKNNAYGSGFGPATMESRNTDGATVSLSGLDAGSYVLTLYDSYGNGDLISQSEMQVSGGSLNVALPSFQGDVAFKVNRGTSSSWGAVPRSGKAWITSGGSADQLVYYASVRPIAGFSDAQAGTVLTLSDSQSPTWELTVPALATSKGFWTVAEINAPSQTGLALVNTGSAPASVVLVIHDGSGRQADSKSLTLKPGEHVARFLVEWFGPALAPFRGALEVRSDQPLGALALRGTNNELGQFIMTSIPARGDEGSASEQTSALPQVADGFGYQTEWLLVNPSDAPLTGRVTFRKSDGTPWTLTIAGSVASELPYSVSPHGLLRWTTAGTDGSTSVGYCLLTPDAGQGAPAGGAVIRYLPGGRLGSETGLPFLPLSTTAGTYWEVGPDLDTGIALVNPADKEQQFSLQLYLRDGVEQVRQALVTIPAGGHRARFVTELFPGLSAASRGYLRMSAGSACGFLPLRMRTTPNGVLFSSLLLGPLAGGADRVIPQVVNGGGYRTQFIILNPGDLSSSGRVSFCDPTGVPARLLLHRP
jgi:hypothetical protein